MSRKLGRNVTLKLSRAHSTEPAKRLKDDCEGLVTTRRLYCIIEVPDAAGPIEICADLSGRTVSCTMRLAAPKDKKTAQSRINWIVRQLGKADSASIFVNAIWPGRARDTQAGLTDLRENPQLLRADNVALVPQYFDVAMVRDLAGKFTGRRTFIEHLEAIVPSYYEQVGQHLRAWVPPPPKLVESGKDATEGKVLEKEQPEPSQENTYPVTTSTWQPRKERLPGHPAPNVEPSNAPENEPDVTGETHSQTDAAESRSGTHQRSD